MMPCIESCSRRMEAGSGELPAVLPLLRHAQRFTRTAWRAAQDLQARDDINGDILTVRDEGPDGMAIAAVKNSSPTLLPSRPFSCLALLFA